MPSVIESIIEKIGEPVKRTPTEYVFRCPFCEYKIGKVDTKGHLYINENDGFFCHRCESKGKINWLLKKLEITHDDVVGVIPETDALRDKLFNTLNALDDEVKETPIEPVEIKLPDKLCPVWCMPNVYKYALSRGLSDYACKYYNLYGYTDRFGNERLLFSDYLNGKLVFWQARAIKDDVFPKYETAKGVEKSHCVWNLGRVSPNRVIYVAEGIMSARACGSNGVAIYGKHLSNVQKKLIMQYSGPKGVCIVLDGSAMDSAYKIAESFLKSMVPTSLVKLPGKLDPDELCKQDAKLLSELLYNAQPMTESDILKVRIDSIWQ